VNQAHQTNVLKINTTLSVTVARQRISLERVLGLVPGAMLTFTKHYADPMEVHAAGQPIAHGEIVKVGDKFGIRIIEMLRPAAQ
jgi:flagellar motor switch protein FliN